MHLCTIPLTYKHAEEAEGVLREPEARLVVGQVVEVDDTEAVVDYQHQAYQTNPLQRPQVVFEAVGLEGLEAGGAALAQEADPCDSQEDGEEDDQDREDGEVAVKVEAADLDPPVARLVILQTGHKQSGIILHGPADTTDQRGRNL